jgi:energy-converting hydrogenase A subunit C
MADFMIEKIIGFIIIIMAIRSFITKNRVERILYINVIDFGLSALIAIYINTPFGFIVGSTFFITSTISSNAIAYTFNRLKNEIVFD